MRDYTHYIGGEGTYAFLEFHQSTIIFSYVPFHLIYYTYDWVLNLFMWFRHFIDTTIDNISIWNIFLCMGHSTIEYIVSFTYLRINSDKINKIKCGPCAHTVEHPRWSSYVAHIYGSAKYNTAHTAPDIQRVPQKIRKVEHKSFASSSTLIGVAKSKRSEKINQPEKYPF
jgi:hypothetical protein